MQELLRHSLKHSITRPAFLGTLLNEDVYSQDSTCFALHPDGLS